MMYSCKQLQDLSCAAKNSFYVNEYDIVEVGGVTFDRNKKMKSLR